MQIDNDNNFNNNNNISVDDRMWQADANIRGQRRWWWTERGLELSNEANYERWALSKNKGMDDANMVRMMMLMMVCGSVVVQIYISRYSTNDFVWSL